MKFGTLNLISTLEECEAKFKRLHDLGMEACHLVYKPEKFTKEASDRIRSCAEKYEIDICAQFAGFRDGEINWDDLRFTQKTAGLGVPAYRMERIRYVKETIDFAAMTGIPQIIIHAGFIPYDTFSETYADILTAVVSVAKYAKTKNIEVLLETGMETPITMLGFIKDTGMDNVFINFDPANILMYGYGNPVDALKIFGPYVKNMHGKDGCLPTVPHRLGDEKKVGEGMVDFPAIFKILKEIGYDRYCVIEREIGGDQQIRDILDAKEYLQGLL